MLAPRKVVTILAIVSLSAAVAGCASPEPQGSNGQGGGATGGEALVSEKCSQCHSIDRVDAAVKDKTAWQTTVERMEQNGMEVTAEERATIVDWLAERDADR